MKTNDGMPARAACAATELARLPVEAAGDLACSRGPCAAVAARLTTRSLKEWVGLAESSLTHSPPVRPSSVGQPVGAHQRGQARVEA